jgi:hypothetical protein
MRLVIKYAGEAEGARKYNVSEGKHVEVETAETGTYASTSAMER